MEQLTSSQAAVETINKATKNRTQLVDMIAMNQLSEIEIETETSEK
jgi:hypothetical protein